MPLSHEQTLRDGERAAVDLARLHHPLRRDLAESLMLAAELIRHKRAGGELTAEQIEFLVAGITDGSLSDAQAGALAMAIVWRGMTAAERVALTGAMTRSGDVLDWSTPGSATARCSTSTRPAASATRSACCSRRSSPRAAARCR